jgi:uncharacterized metal-binding protein YceD (DUF177 family)
VEAEVRVLHQLLTEHPEIHLIQKVVDLIILELPVLKQSSLTKEPLELPQQEVQQLKLVVLVNL